MRRWFEQLPIERKLTAVTLGVVITALVVTASGLVAVELWRGRAAPDVLDRAVMAVAAGLTMLLIGAAIALAVSRRLHPVIWAPFARLADAARRFGDDDAGRIADIAAPPDETGELVAAFRTMADRVNAANRGLVESNQALRAEVEVRRSAEAEREALLEREREANRLKDQFLSAVSHELRTPLNAIVGWTEVLTSIPPTPQLLSRGLEGITRNARAQARVIDDLLDISRISTGRLTLTCGSVDLAQVIANACDAVRPIARSKEIVLTLRRPADGGCMVYGDADRLQQVCWNLLSNAVKFTPAAGSVEVRLSHDDHACTIVVADTGMGIGADFLPHVFEPFRQHDGSTAREHNGLGVGLSLVKQLVEMHGGGVHAESGGPGLGARFTVRLPAERHESRPAHVPIAARRAARTG